MGSASGRHKPMIGLLGGIGSGKSTVARCFAQLGCAVIDADALAQQVLDEPEVQRELARWWGPEVVGPDGRTRRSLISARVFDRPEELRRLEALVHPRVLAERARLREEYDRRAEVVAVVDDTPLLLDKGLEGDCDALVFVDTPREIRLQRVQKSRGWDAAELDRREARQMPLDIKAQRADYVVDNRADESHCLAQVRQVLSQILTKTRPR